jgi:hypothetical protein
MPLNPPTPVDDEARVPAEAVRQRIRPERDRNELADLTDADGFESALRRAAKRLPGYAPDNCFAWIIRQLWIAHGDDLPDSLEVKYRALRDEVAWLEDHVQVTGEIEEAGLHQLARLLTSFAGRERQLHELVHGRARL